MESVVPAESTATAIVDEVEDVVVDVPDVEVERFLVQDVIPSARAMARSLFMFEIFNVEVLLYALGLFLRNYGRWEDAAASGKLSLC